MSVIKIKSHIHNYEVTFGKFGSFLCHVIEKKFSPRCYLIDKNVWRLYKNTYFNSLKDSEVILFEANEFNKSLSSVSGLYDKLIEQSAKRNTVLISVGGGITQDVSGFFASTLYRGIKWVFIPTTLLAQADSCIGSKTSLNYKNYKNLVGTFYPPLNVLIDTNFINTQKTSDFYSGLGEIIKLHIMGGRRYAERIRANLPKIVARQKQEIKQAIYDSLLIKKSYIEEDEFDTGRRNLLNYGHCFGHALETTSNFRVVHGQAVIFGIILANIISRSRRLLSRSFEDKIFRQLLQPVVACNPLSYLRKKDAIVETMKKDKKRTGKKLPLIIMRDDYKIEKLLDVDEKEVKAALEELTQRNK